MTFWQENYAFIKDVYDTRAEKMVDIMDKTEKAIGAVKADVIYTSAEFKKVKEGFMSLSKNLEQPDTKEWLSSTKDTLMNEKNPKEQDEEGKKLNGILERYDKILPEIADTKAVVDCLWKSYQFADELAPLMEWLEEMVSKSTREVSTNNASDTEDLIEKQEKTLDQLDKKKKVVMDQRAKGEKILADPKSPKFLEGHIDKLKALWAESNNEGDKRLNALKDNLAAWERYESQRDSLADKLNQADSELMDTKKVFDLEAGPADHDTRVKTAASMRGDIENTFKTVSEANDILQKLLGDDMKCVLNEEVEGLKSRLVVLNDMDEKLKKINEFNGKLKVYDGTLKEFEGWLGTGRTRMDELLKPAKPMDPQERVMATMELQSDVQLQIENFGKAKDEWNDLAPSAPGENTPEAQGFVTRIDTVNSTQGGLLGEVKEEGAKFGEDVKYLADFTSGVKKFDPWIQKAEAKKATGMLKPKNLEEALDYLEDAKKWQKESEEMTKILEEANAAAQKMTLHEDADAKYAAFKKRLEVIKVLAKEWISKYDSMIVVWKKQAETAEKVQAAIAAKPSGEGPQQEMKLEDLEKHLDTLKQMFIEKQKMMEALNKENGEPKKEGEAAPKPEAEPAPAAPPAPAEPVAS